MAKHLEVHHAMARYLFRHDNDGPLWDNQENWIAGDPVQLPNYMRRWNDRLSQQGMTDGVFQEELLLRVQNGLWNTP